MHLLPTTTSSKLGSSRYSSNVPLSPPSFAGFDLERHRSFTQGSPPRWSKQKRGKQKRDLTRMALSTGIYGIFVIAASAA